MIEEYKKNCIALLLYLFTVNSIVLTEHSIYFFYESSYSNNFTKSSFFFFSMHFNTNHKSTWTFNLPLSIFFKNYLLSKKDFLTYFFLHSHFFWLRKMNFSFLSFLLIVIHSRIVISFFIVQFVLSFCSILFENTFNTANSD